MIEKGAARKEKALVIRMNHQGRAGIRWTKHLNPLKRIAHPF